MDVEEEWVYRERDMAPSQRVRIVSFEQRKTSRRASIEFLDGERTGTVESVPAGRLRCLWSDVESYDYRMAHWQRIGGYELTEAEEMAMLVAFEHLIPEDIADTSMGYARHATGVLDAAGLERITQRPLSTFTDLVASFRDGDEWWLSAEGSLAIAEAACRVTPMPVLDWVMAEERRCRDACKRGMPRTSRDGDKYTSSPDWEYAFYLEHERPVHELLRQWCGHRAVSFQERLEAAEAELHRLDELIARAADAFRDNKLDHHAKWLDEEHERDRITPHTIRPIVDRPIDPREIPVHVVYKKGWWH
ncbi:hypothetical protein [Propionicimonas sp.]|uniref:hypothetical protein n=1 Tax=Propionicimonas sp. TaxID=1955623 RepID=UPI0039E27591